MMVWLMVFLGLAPAGAVEFERVGAPAIDAVFDEIEALDRVLDAAEGRLVRLRREVARLLGMPADSPMVRVVWVLKEQAGGDVRVMQVEGRPLVALGMEATPAAKRAASLLNEGTQEVAVMAADLSRLPSHVQRLLGKVDGGSTPVLERNRYVAEQVERRASELAERARGLLEAVREGVEATEEPEEVTPLLAVEETPPPVRSIPDLLSEAWVAVKRAQYQEAKALLDRADLLLPRQTVPVSRGDLLELFQMRAHVCLELGDATGAAWAAAQALTIYPTGEPFSKFGSTYAKLHRALAKADIVRRVEVLATGEGRAYLSGQELGRGSALLLGQGQHLLQIERGDHWESAVVEVYDGLLVEL